MEEKFRSFNELVENLSRGGEVEFRYKGKEYSITHIDEGIVISEQYNYNSEKIYSDPTSVGEYSIDGEPLKEVIIKAEITFRCF